MSLNKIYIEDLKVNAIIGILDKERENEQEIIANIVIEYIREGSYFINYAHVASLIEEKLKQMKYGLLEDAIKDMMLHIKEDYPSAKSIKMKLSKPQIIDNCTVSVEISERF
ncbi:MAG: dihydroneopterin aldolase [Sulfurospirillum sp.]|nr:MAG: dihydroneopterin aldolase [Sulfurospirillum sp.]